MIGPEALATRGAAPVALPAPRVEIRIRPATLADVPFMDSLQKVHSKQLGYFPTKQFEGYVEMGGVLIAEGHEGTEARRHEVPEWATERHEGTEARRHEVPECAAAPASGSDPFVPSCLRASVPSPLGYIISRDRYLKRDELGVIYQLCVVPGDRRKLVGAALLKAVFDRSAYGCRLYCCWCAQDLAANHFWESMGFVPIAFRAGSGKKGRRRSDEATKGRGPEESSGSGPSVAGSLRRSVASSRVHIFWQKRIRPGDTTTPWWFPAKTEGGAMREDRLVLPIPPGYHWSDEMPALRSEGTEARRHEGTQGADAAGDDPGASLRASVPSCLRASSRKKKHIEMPEVGSTCGPQEPTPHPKKRIRASFGLPGSAPPAPPAPRASRQFGGPDESPEPVLPAANAPPAQGPDDSQGQAKQDAAKKAPPKREKAWCDPKLISAARELRDRWLEEVEYDPTLLLPAGKYDVSRALPSRPGSGEVEALPERIEVKALPAAA